MQPPWMNCLRSALIEVDLSGKELEAPPSTRAEDPLSLKWMNSAIPDLMATSSQASPHAGMPENIPSIIQVSHSPFPPNVPKTLEAARISPIPQSQAPFRADPTDLLELVLQLQGEMNVALKWLLMTKATMDSCWRQLTLNASITMHQNEAQATEAIKEAEKRWQSTVQLWSRRQRPIVPSMPAPWNNPTC